MRGIWKCYESKKKFLSCENAFIALFFAFVFTNCGPKGSNPFSKSDEQVDENVANLMGLSVGMTKGQVFDLVGVANYMEGYDWKCLEIQN